MGSDIDQTSPGLGFASGIVDYYTTEVKVQEGCVVEMTMTPSTNIARAQTFDGRTVKLWDDGVLTWAFGHYIDGIGCPRSAKTRADRLAAGWLMMGDLALYTAEELPKLYQAALTTVRKGGTPGDMRTEFARTAAS